MLVVFLTNMFCQVQPDPTPESREAPVSPCVLPSLVVLESTLSLTTPLSTQTPRHAPADVEQATEGSIPVP